MRFTIAEHFSELRRVLNADPPAMFDSLLRLLMDMGFDSARYYNAAQDDVSGRSLFVLIAEHTRKTHQPQNTGYQASWEDSSHHILDQPLVPLVATAKILERAGHRPPWIAHFGLDTHPWVDIPIIARDELLGVLSAEWTGDPGDLSERSLALLECLGMSVGAQLALMRDLHVRVPLVELSRLHNPADLLSETAGSIADRMNAALAAVFEYRWPSGTLVKICDHPAPQGTSILFPEHYTVGEYLTGRAWLDPRYRYISDFERFAEEQPDLVDPVAHEHHRMLLGGDVRTILYAVVGRAEPRYLIRLINRCDTVDLPFMTERGWLNAWAETLSVRLDEMTARRRLRHLEEVAREAVSEPTNPQRVMDTIRDHLTEDHVAEFGAAFHTVGSTRFSFRTGVGQAFQKWKHAPTEVLASQEVYVRAVEGLSEEGAFDRLQPLFYPTSELRSEAPGVMELRNSKMAGVLAFPVAAGNTRGAFFIAVPDALIRSLRSNRKNVAAALEERVPESIAMIHAYAQLAGKAVDARSSYRTLEGARRVLGYVGHELVTPIAILANKAVEALMLAQDIVAERATPEALAQYDRLENAYEDIEEIRGQLAQIMSHATYIAQGGTGERQYHFAKTSMSRIVLRARDQVLEEIARRAHALEPPMRHVEIRVNEACRRLPDVVCDGYAIGQVVVNTLRNAVKYSLPRHKGQPIVVRMLAQPQENMIVLRVENWGIGIPSDKLEDIFEPFVRGDVVDDRQALRGMGLGLALARGTMAAHKGEIICVRSEPTLNDPSKTMRHEGYETIFEIRLPCTLREGTVTRESR